MKGALISNNILTMYYHKEIPDECPAMFDHWKGHTKVIVYE